MYIYIYIHIYTDTPAFMYLTHMYLTRLPSGCALCVCALGHVYRYESKKV